MNKLIFFYLKIFDIYKEKAKQIIDTKHLGQLREKVLEPSKKNPPKDLTRKLNSTAENKKHTALFFNVVDSDHRLKLINSNFLNNSSSYSSKWKIDLKKATINQGLAGSSKFETETGKCICDHHSRWTKKVERYTKEKDNFFN